MIYNVASLLTGLGVCDHMYKAANSAVQCQRDPFFLVEVWGRHGYLRKVRMDGYLPPRSSAGHELAEGGYFHQFVWESL